MHPLVFLMFACSNGSKAPAGGSPDDTASTDGATDSGAGPACPLPAYAPPDCGTGPAARDSVLAGPGDPGWSATLGERADRVERQANGLTAWATGAACEVRVVDDGPRATVTDYIDHGEFVDGGQTDFLDATGVAPDQVVERWGKVAGAYGGAGIAADAWRYGALRDEGADCAEVQAAHDRLVVGMQALHKATAITGVDGVIARGFARKDLPGDGENETTPLFDDDGQPLPEEKNNGTWRQDQSGAYADHIWEDSCSRDQYIGWVAGMAAAWEVVRDDPAFDPAAKDQLQADARALAASLMVVRESGYDLEIMDADGRMTYHGILHHESVDRVYVPGGRNSLNATMTLGIVAALALVAEDPTVDAWLADDLIAERDLPGIVREQSRQIALGNATNFSNYNMVYIGGLLALRYLCDDDARAGVAAGMADLYQGDDRDPIVQSQALYDLVYALGQGDGTAFRSGGAPPDEAAVAKIDGLLGAFREPPYWNIDVQNCDADEIASGVCELDDGTMVTLLGYVGRNDTLVSEEPIPMGVRPSSNYLWRSHPFEPNSEGDGSWLYPNTDWRLVYWAGRWAHR
ncbi:MAG: hypothetical protein H6742_10910 [Alphaproteobacteria bacterium]|nr:hypothetical protein [Alphaproteobacteria bacterium]